VFNDILIGKDTNQPSEQPTEQSPFRADPAATDLECPGCRQLFPAAQAVAGKCRTCAPPIDAALEAMKGPKLDYLDHGGNERKRDFGLAILMVGVLAAIVLTGFYVKLQLRTTTHHDDIESTFSDEARALQEKSREQFRRASE
jgi:hypothetical protein